MPAAMKRLSAEVLCTADAAAGRMRGCCSASLDTRALHMQAVRPSADPAARRYCVLWAQWRARQQFLLPALSEGFYFCDFYFMSSPRGA